MNGTSSLARVTDNMPLCLRNAIDDEKRGEFTEDELLAGKKGLSVSLQVLDTHCHVVIPRNS